MPATINKTIDISTVGDVGGDDLTASRVGNRVLPDPPGQLNYASQIMPHPLNEQIRSHLHLVLTSNVTTATTMH
jgi:hypothetical protein